MITDEQVLKACEVFYEQNTTRGQNFGTAMRKALEAYEASKPKTEPVGYIYKHRLDQMLESEVDNDCNFFPIKDDISRVIFNSKRDKYIPLYTTPPTREPLSDDDEIWEIWANTESTTYIGRVIKFARAIEQAHGIGVTLP